MDTSLPLLLRAAELAELARSGAATALCTACRPLLHPGWESMPGGFDRALLRRVGSLREASGAEPSLAEYHPDGTDRWSAKAPISPAHHPYNLCDVWQCAPCRRVYLRYTEYGGYYQDERVRWVDPDLVVG